MNIYHAWCDLKVGVSDIAFREGVAKYLDHLRAQELIESWRLTRRKLGFDKGYRGHDTANPHRVFVSGQKRGVFGIIKRELRRRSAIEAVIGHMKNDGHLGRCHLKGREGDAANVILTAVGHNLRLVLAWLSSLLRLILLALCRFLTDDEIAARKLSERMRTAEMAAENTAQKQRGQPFRKGQSGNPRGRPPGARNAATMLAEQLLDGEAETLTRKAVKLALAGDTVALRLCLDRILPPRRERPVRFRMPELASATDAAKAMAALTAAVASGELTPPGACELSKLVETYIKTIEATEIERRLRALEERQPHNAS